jgi:hypothetical protein
MDGYRDRHPSGQSPARNQFRFLQKFGRIDLSSRAIWEGGPASAIETLESLLMALTAQRTQANAIVGSRPSAARPDGATITLALHWLQTRLNVDPATVSSASANAQTRMFYGSISPFRPGRLPFKPPWSVRHLTPCRISLLLCLRPACLGSFPRAFLPLSFRELLRAGESAG